MSPTGQAFGRRKHLNHRPGGEAVFVNQVKSSNPVWHGSSIWAIDLQQTRLIVFLDSALSLCENSLK